MKLSDYVAQFIKGLGVSDIFLISGGGMMHLLDSVGKCEGLNVICNLNEQATSICADSYGQFTNKLGVCMVTTGPGGTNAVTGVAASWLDSTPVLVISGQVKTTDSAETKGVRQYGAQEIDIVSIVKPITKYAVTVKDKNKIKYYLEKAVHLATTNRRGPVWLDIPLDIQGAQIEVDQLEAFDAIREEKLEKDDHIEQYIPEVYTLLNQAKRPVFLVGHGVIAAGAKEKFRQLGESLGIPILTTWRVKGLLEEGDPLYFGHPGSPAARFSNYVLQNSDLLIIIGTRLNASLTVYAESRFGLEAKRVIVDIDEQEVSKLDMKFEIKIIADAGKFIDAMYKEVGRCQQSDREEWLKYCRCMKEKYALSKEKQPIDNEGLTDGFLLGEKLSEYTNAEDIFVGSSSGRTCGISHMAYRVKKDQKFVSSMGLGSMGFTIPSAIACCIAGGRRRTVAIEGDGSLQHNIQELQLITNYKLPIKLFVVANKGYASIYMMQKNNFAENYVACDAKTHLEFPKLEDVAKLYNLSYYCIDCNEKLDQILPMIMADDTPVLCEVVSSIYFDEIPKSMTKAHSDGTFSSSLLEDLYPFLKPEELTDNMPRWE